MGYHLLSILLLGAGMASAQEIGVNSVVKNEVSIRSETETDARAATVGDDVLLRDTITSGNESALQVLLLDETVFTVGPNAELVVDRFIYDPDQGAGEMAASVARGAFRFMSGRTANNPRNVSIDTPVASMGVRGTIVEAAIGVDAIEDITGLEDQFADIALNNQSTLIVLRGPGDGNTSLNKDGAVDVTTSTDMITLTKSNTAVLIPSEDGPIIGPFALPQSSVEGFSKMLRTTPTGTMSAEVPPIDLNRGIDNLDGEPVDPVIDPEEETITERPIGACPINDGIPVTDGGIILDGDSDQVFDDFGSLDCLE